MIVMCVYIYLWGSYYEFLIIMCVFNSKCMGASYQFRKKTSILDLC